MNTYVLFPFIDPGRVGHAGIIPAGFTFSKDSFSVYQVRDLRNRYFYGIFRHGNGNHGKTDISTGMFPWIARVLLKLHYKCTFGVIYVVWYVNVAAAISAVTDVHMYMYWQYYTTLAVLLFYYFSDAQKQSYSTMTKLLRTRTY